MSRTARTGSRTRGRTVVPGELGPTFSSWRVNKSRTTRTARARAGKHGRF